jgi:hypothetical protein
MSCSPFVVRANQVLTVFRPMTLDVENGRGVLEWVGLGFESWRLAA